MKQKKVNINNYQLVEVFADTAIIYDKVDDKSFRGDAYFGIARALGSLLYADSMATSSLVGIEDAIYHLTEAKKKIERDLK